MLVLEDLVPEPAAVVAGAGRGPDAELHHQRDLQLHLRGAPAARDGVQLAGDLPLHAAWGRGQHPRDQLPGQHLQDLVRDAVAR